MQLSDESRGTIRDILHRYFWLTHNSEDRMNAAIRFEGLLISCIDKIRKEFVDDLKGLGRHDYEDDEFKFSNYVHAEEVDELVAKYNSEITKDTVVEDLGAYDPGELYNAIHSAVTIEGSELRIQTKIVDEYVQNVIKKTEEHIRAYIVKEESKAEEVQHG